MNNGSTPPPTLLVHVGMPKTASTWFQEIHWDGHARIHRLLTPYEIGPRFVWPTDDYDESATAAWLQSELARHRREGRMCVLSREGLGRGLTGDPTSALALERIVRIVPEAKAWVVLRDQRAWLLASWQQRIKDTTTRLGLHEFVNGGDDGETKDKWRRILDYDAAVARLEGIFGADRVRVDCYEEFVARPAAFVADVDAWLGLPPTVKPAVRRRPNRSLSLRSTHVLRSLRWAVGHNRVGHPRTRRSDAAAGFLGGIDRVMGWSGVTSDRRLRAKFDEVIGPWFEASNQALQRRRPDVPLGRYGYAGC